jgi:hypothetical protein
MILQQDLEARERRGDDDDFRSGYPIVSDLPFLKMLGLQVRDSIVALDGKAIETGRGYIQIVQELLARLQAEKQRVILVKVRRYGVGIITVKWVVQ